MILFFPNNSALKAWATHLVRDYSLYPPWSIPSDILASFCKTVKCFYCFYTQMWLFSDQYPDLPKKFGMVWRFAPMADPLGWNQFWRSIFSMSQYTYRVIGNERENLSSNFLLMKSSKKSWKHISVNANDTQRNYLIPKQFYAEAIKSLCL